MVFFEKKKCLEKPGHTLLRRGCLCDDNTVRFFSPRSMYQCVLKEAKVYKKCAEAASLRVRITHWFLPIGDIVWKEAKEFF